SDRGLPPRAEPGDPRRGPRAAAVLPGRRLSAAAAISLDLPAAVRPRGAPGRDPDRQRVAAGVRPDRSHPDRSGRLRGDRAADLPARDAGLPVVRRPAPERALGRDGTPRRRVRAAPRAPHAEALLLSAERPQSDRAGGGARDGAATARRRRPPPGAD